jgi:monomeric sarcosine oxidase
MRRVVVIGGGVMGSAAAWQLAARGFDVTVLEQFTRGHTEGSSHGSSRIFRLAYPDRFYVDLAARALPLWRQLEAETGRSVLTLTGAVDHGPRPAVDALHQALTAAGQPSERLDPSAAAERWPGLRFEESVLFHPSAGRLHADHAVEAFQLAAAARGADLRFGVRVGKLINRGGERVDVITADGTVITANHVVIAVGGWAPALVPTVAVGLPPLRVTQEQPAHFPAADPLAWPSFIHHGGAELPEVAGIYGLGSADGVKVGFHGVGPVVDPDRRDRSVDPIAQRHVQDYAARWLPGVDSSRPTSTTCLYTTTPNHDFVIDRTGQITVLAGFSGHGFKFAAVIGRLAADLVEGSPGAARFALAS